MFGACAAEVLEVAVAMGHLDLSIGCQLDSLIVVMVAAANLD